MKHISSLTHHKAVTTILERQTICLLISGFGIKEPAAKCQDVYRTKWP